MKTPIINIEELQKNCYWTIEDEDEQFDGIFRICSTVDGKTLLKVDLREKFIAWGNFLINRFLDEAEKKFTADGGSEEYKKGIQEMADVLEKQISNFNL